MKNMIQLSYEISESEILQTIKKLANKSAYNYLNWAFNDGSFSTQKGIEYINITQKIDALICSDEAAAIIEKTIEDNWKRMLKEATVKALQHKANKLAFTQTK